MQYFFSIRLDPPYPSMPRVQETKAQTQNACFLHWRLGFKAVRKIYHFVPNTQASNGHPTASHVNWVNSRSVIDQRPSDQ